MNIMFKLPPTKLVSQGQVTRNGTQQCLSKLLKLYVHRMYNEMRRKCFEKTSPFQKCDMRLNCGDAQRYAELYQESI